MCVCTFGMLAFSDVLLSALVLIQICVNMVNLKQQAWKEQGEKEFGVSGLQLGLWGTRKTG